MIKKKILSKKPRCSLRGQLFCILVYWSWFYLGHNAEQSHYNRSSGWTLDLQSVAFFFRTKHGNTSVRSSLAHLNVPKVARKWVAAWSVLTQAPKLTRPSVFSSSRSWALHWENPTTTTTTPAGSRLASSRGMSSPGRKYQRRTNTRTNHPAVA